MALTPLQMIAGEGLLQNTALGVSPALQASISAYLATPLMQAFIPAANAYPSLQTLAAGTVPAFSNSLPSAYASLGSQMTTAITAQATLDAGSGDISKFVQAFNIVTGYAQLTNQLVNSAVNSRNYLSDTFTSTNDSITGDITTVNLATPAFGQDLQNLGRLINLARLDLLGSPLVLLQNVILIIGSTPTLSTLLVNRGVPQDIVLNLTNPTVTATSSVQRLMYQAMTQVTGSELAQILKVLRVTTVNISTMADLLNPVKLFPNSFQSLTVSLPAGIRAIYVNASGAVNTGLIPELPPFVVDRYNNLKQIIPEDQALANCALSVALSQITGISNLDLPAFSAVVKGMQTTKDLPAVTALTTAVPPSVANYYSSTLAQGNGVNGTIQVADVIGLAGGWIATDAFTQTVGLFGEMDLTTLTTIYQRMATALSGGYGDTQAGPITIPPGPGAGTYVGVEIDPGPPPVYNPTAISLAMSDLISAALAEIAALQAAYPAQTAELNTLWNSMAQQIADEKSLQTTANLIWSDLQANSRNSIYGFIQSLPSFGTQTEQGGVVWLLESMAQISNLGGQAVIGCLREGRNLVALNASGIGTNTSIPDSPIPPPPAQLLPSTYSESQAENLAVK